MDRWERVGALTDACYLRCMAAADANNWRRFDHYRERHKCLSAYTRLHLADRLDALNAAMRTARYAGVADFDIRFNAAN